MANKKKILDRIHVNSKEERFITLKTTNRILKIMQQQDSSIQPKMK